MYVPPGAKLVVVFNGRSLGLPLNGAAGVGTLHGVSLNPLLRFGRGWEAVYVA